jgi:hypothetical protein
MVHPAGDAIVAAVASELGRALLLADVVTPDAMAKALVTSVRDRVSLVRALLSTNALSIGQLEAELETFAPAGTPFQPEPVPLTELIHRLPPHLCEALVAIPVRSDEAAVAVDVALADASDAHAASEIAFFLEAPVRVVRAPLGVIEAVIAQTRVDSSPPSSGVGPVSVPPPSPVRRIAHTPPWGSPPLSVDEDSNQKEVPIPLSRRLTPGAGLRALARAAQALEDEDDPVVELRRSKVPTVIQTRPEDHEREHAPTFDAHAAATSPSTPLSHILREMTKVVARDPLMELVLMAVRPMASKAALFAVKKDVFAGLMCTSDFGDREALASVRIDAKQPSLLATMATVGNYVGPLPRSAAHAPLAPFITAAKPKVLGVSIRAAGRSAVLLLAHDVPDPLRAMTVFTEVAQAAGEALERILRANAKR